jgi:hypothetical protein
VELRSIGQRRAGAAAGALRAERSGSNWPTVQQQIGTVHGNVISAQTNHVGGAGGQPGDGSFGGVRADG